MGWKDLTEEQGRQWACGQRNLYWRRLLSPKVIADCESIPGWSWDLKRPTFLPFADARALAQSLGLRNYRDWYAYCKSGKRPADMPTNPNKIYAGKGWVSLGDWLGTKSVAHQCCSFLPFEEARAFARSLGLKSYRDWQAYYKSNKRPANIPTDPCKIYADSGWNGYEDWLGSKRDRRAASIKGRDKKAKATGA